MTENVKREDYRAAEKALKESDKVLTIFNGLSAITGITAFGTFIYGTLGLFFGLPFTHEAFGITAASGAAFFLCKYAHHRHFPKYKIHKGNLMAAAGRLLRREEPS